MTLSVATCLAAALIEQMRPFCACAQIAGSIRRKKADGIKDVEIVAVPQWESGITGDLFGTTERRNALHGWATSQRMVSWIKPGTDVIQPSTVQSDGKYWRGMWSNGVKLDLFLATPNNFGLILLIRTGPAAWSRRFVTPKRKGGWLPDHLIVMGGQLLQRDGPVIPTPTEEDVFLAAHMEWLLPERRVA